MAKLTAQQEKFAQAIALEDMNQADAYRSAYNTSRMTDKSIWEKASELAANVKVRSRVAELRKMAMTPKVMNAQERRETLTDIAKNPEASLTDRMKAIDLLNKMDGEYVQKVEAQVQTETTINIELVDDDE
jgi:phage terminase small subunit